MEPPKTSVKLDDMTSVELNEWRQLPVSEIAKLDAEIERLRAQVADRGQIIGSLHDEIARLQGVIVGGDREIKTSHADCDRYRAEIERLRNERKNDPPVSESEYVRRLENDVLRYEAALREIAEKDFDWAGEMRMTARAALERK